MNTKVSERQPLLHAGLTKEILGAYFTVYNALGYGFLEAVYAKAICIELNRRKVAFSAEVPLAVTFAGIVVGEYRADIVCEDKVLVELKAGPALHPAAHAQTLNYVRATGFPLGLLVHFGPRPEFHRVVNPRHLNESQDPATSVARSASGPVRVQ